MAICPAPTFTPTSGLTCALRSVGYILTLILLVLISWLVDVRCAIARLRFRIAHCTRGNNDPSIDLLFDLDAWLAEHRDIAESIVWAEAELRPYPVWIPGEKRQLAQTFRRVYEDEVDRLLPDAPAPASVVRGVAFDRPTAWAMFLAYVAQSLAADVRGWVPWRISAYDPAMRAELLDSRSLLQYQPGTGLWGFDIERHGLATPSDPLRAFAFLRGGRLAGSRRETIERVLEWCRGNLLHNRGVAREEDPYVAHWQYPGLPPVQRIIDGTTLFSRTDPSTPRFGHWTLGCGGTSGFLKVVLRAANIPVVVERRCHHFMPAFVSEDLYLAHGDDPYWIFSKVDPPRPQIPISEILLTGVRWRAIFGSGPRNACPPGAHVGIRQDELAVQFLPDELLAHRCRDLNQPNLDASGEPVDPNGPASGVARLLSGTYTVEQLTARDLWNRLDREICPPPGTSGAVGGCRRFEATYRRRAGEPWDLPCQ